MFKFVQALRGIAAFWVLLFHASEGGHIEGLKASLHPILRHLVFDAGDNGVAIFFALSGFVIAHSIRGAEITPGFVGRFALRRSVRLDPPYWAAMLLVIALAFASAGMRGEPFVAPRPEQVVAHIFYLQTLLSFQQINPVFWTLTYEIQFYIVLVIGAGIAQRAFRPLVLASAFLVALLWGTGLMPETVHGLFVNLWHSFFIGALAYWALTDRRAATGLLLLAAILLTTTASTFTVVAVSTALVLFAAGKAGFLEQGLGAPALQFLGSISYSLYLTHNPLTGAVFFATSRLGLPDLVALVIVIACCLIAATLFWWVIERPSQRWAKRIGRPRATPPSDPDALSPPVATARPQAD